ncbi:MAG: bifunctional 4-hydroxy-2-oxoglutarate aldolase/2-dehydro-3-deoxy-phosphogluconate aldolase [Planctomycetota bacterium]
MNRHEQATQIRETAFVAVLRADSSEQLIDVAQALKAGGCNLIEVTMTTPGALETIEQASDALGEEVLLGAGSVLDAETTRLAIQAGAQYIVSPVTDYPTIEMAHRYDKVVMPGAYTPTEAINAYKAGADFVKIFPASVGGPQYIKALLAPMPQLALVPTGGVNLDTIQEFIRAGAAACGVGSALVDKEALRQGDMDRIKQNAEAFMEKVRDVRG